MQGLVTDRTQANVLRRSELAAKGWANMNADEKAEWLGSPTSASGVNLLPYAPISSATAKLNYTNDAINVESIAEGTYRYVPVIIGPAEDFENKTMTLSADYIGTADGGNPRLSMFWHGASGGYTSVGVNLTEAGSITFNTGANTDGREYLAMYIYVAVAKSVPVGASARFRGVMLEFGSERHEYTPYMEILPTNTTKGAYNYSDLNRVERAAAELSDLYGLCLETKTDWDVWSIPKASDMIRYVTNVKKIRHASLHPNSMAAAPDSMTGLRFDDANNIEKILLAAHENTDHICRVGELFSGEV